MEWNWVAAASLTDTLRVDGCGTIFANEAAGSFVKTDTAAYLTGVKDRSHLAVGFAIEQKAHLDSVHVGAIAAQVAFSQIFSWDCGVAVVVESDLDGLRERRRP